jgi:hypothetical protein
VQILLIQDGEKDIMIDGRKKLSKVKGDHTSFELGTPSCMDNMSEEATSILGGVLTNAPNLLGWRTPCSAASNCGLLESIFSNILPRVFGRTIGQNNLGVSYNGFPGFGMTTVVEALNSAGQWPD